MTQLLSSPPEDEEELQKRNPREVSGLKEAFENSARLFVNRGRPMKCGLARAILGSTHDKVVAV